jgi:putative transposase
MEWVEGRKLRRFFRARHKLDYPGAISHVTQRAAGIDHIFQEEEDYREFLIRTRKLARTFELEVLAYALMTNHIHLLIRQNQPNLKQAMREIFSRYARWYNTKYARKGHLFGGPYRQALCLEEGYVLRVSLYIHLNPVRAGMVQRPEDYPWTSYRWYQDGNSQEKAASDDGLVASRLLEWLDKDPAAARLRYREMIQTAMAQKSAEVLEDPEAIYRFQWQLSDKVLGLDHMCQCGAPQGAPQGKDIFMAEENLNAAVRAFIAGEGVGHEGLPKTRRGRKYLITQLLTRGYTQREIANRLGLSRRTIYNIIKPKK